MYPKVIDGLLWHFQAPNANGLDHSGRLVQIAPWTTDVTTFARFVLTRERPIYSLFRSIHAHFYFRTPGKKALTRVF